MLSAGILAAGIGSPPCQRDHPIATAPTRQPAAAASHNGVCCESLIERTETAQRGGRCPPRARHWANSNRPARVLEPSMAANLPIDSGRRDGSLWTHAETAAESTAGTSGAKRRTSMISVVCAARSFARELPPDTGGRPESMCHHKQPHAYTSLAVVGGVPAVIRSGAR